MAGKARIIDHRNKGIVLLIAMLLFKTHSAHPTSKLCFSTPCHFPNTALQSIDRPPTSSEEEDNRRYRIENPQDRLNDRDLDVKYFSKRISDDEWGRDYDGLLDRAGYDGGYEDDLLPSRSLILFLLRSPPCDPTVSRCRKTKENLPSEGYDQPRVQEFKLPEKRSRMITQRWSAAGLPFSVLYHKQVRAKGSYGNLGVRGEESQNVAPAPQTATEGWTPTHGVAVRRQYSTLPHLFVSYGWGPLG